MIPSSTPNLWDEALQTLHEEDRFLYSQILAKGTGHRDVLEDVLNSTLSKKEECKKKRWKVVIKGKTIILRDLLEKMAGWVNKFIAVGDSVVQYDPGHAALPWAAIRFILTATISEVEIFGAVLQVVERVSNVMARCVIMESLYLHSNFEVSDHLRKGLIDLYASILGFLGHSLKYYSQNTAKRIAKSLVISTNDVDAWSKPIGEKQANVDHLLTLAEAERAQDTSNNLTQLRTGQLAQDQTLHDTYLALQRLSADLVKPISRIDQRIAKIEDDLERQTRVAIIKSISTINFLAQHKVANSGLLPGSGEWFISKPQFEEWRNESSSSVLWLHGIPGSGKTKLTSMVVTDLKSTSHVVYFYCVRNPVEPERAECDHILTSLVRQLACPSPSVPILAPVISKYEDAIDEMVEFSDIMWTREETVRTLVELCDLHPAVVFVLDALDEVNPMNRLDLLDGLLDIMEQSQSLIKIFISSRENMDIVARLENKPNMRIGAKENTEDIAKFVHQQLKAANLLHGRLPSSLKEKIPETLIEGAQGMFRWVDLQIQSLRPLKVAADIEARLGHLPHTLEESYLEILDQIEASGEYAFKLAVFTFQWLLHAREPIAINDFVLLASIHSGQAAIYTTYEVLDVCQNLVVSNDEGIFRFVHLSVREFLESLGKAEIKCRRISYFTSEEANAAIGSASLSYLRATMESGPATVDSHLTISRQIKESLAVRNYTANYWPFHVSQAGSLKHTSPLSVEVRSFIIKDTDVAPTFTHWCTIVSEKMGGAALSVIRDVAQLPPNPIWLVHAYDIINIHHVSIKDRNRQSEAFVYAAEIGNVKVMAALLEQGLDIKDMGLEAMKKATSGAHGDAVSLLLDQNVPVDPDWLLQAVVTQQSNVVVPLVSKGYKNFSTTDLIRGFRISTASGDFESVSAFVGRGVKKDPLAVVRALKAATPNATLNLINTGFEINGSYLLEERTALHWASERGFSEVVRSLLEKCVQVDVRDTWGNSPLHLAAWKGRSGIVKILLYHWADRTLRNRDGRIPLHLAAMMGHFAAVNELKGDGFEIEARDGEGKTALDYAESYGRHKIVAILSGRTSTPYNPVDEKVQEIPFSDPSPPGNVQLDAEGVSSLYTTIPILPEPPSPTEEDTLVNMEKPSISYQQQYQTESKKIAAEDTVSEKQTRVDRCLDLVQAL